MHFMQSVETAWQHNEAYSGTDKHFNRSNKLVSHPALQQSGKPQQTCIHSNSFPDVKDKCHPCQGELKSVNPEDKQRKSL